MDKTKTVYNFNSPMLIPATVPFYKGEFGFDWLRIGDNGEPSYESIISTGYERPSLGDTNTEYENNVEAYKFLKRKYKSLPTQKTDEQYYIPYLSLFSQTYSNRSGNIPKPTFQATLRVLVQIEENLSKLEFDYDPTLFTINKTVLNDKTPASPISKKESIDQTITITCLKSFSETKAIKILAYPTGVTNKSDAKLAGIIWLNKNEKIDNVNIALISVHTDVNNDSTDEIGIFMPEEILNLKYILYQNLLNFNIKAGLSLDLTNDINFQQSFNSTTPSIPITKNYIHKDGGILTNENNISTTPPVHTYLRTKFLTPSNSVYSNYFTVFSFDVKNTYEDYDSSGNIIFENGTLGEVQDVGIKNVVLYKPPGNTSIIPRDLTTLNHECMHGYGLYHTHVDISPISSSQIEFVYPNALSLSGPNKLKGTDNVMSYYDTALVLWNWQKRHINLTI